MATDTKGGSAEMPTVKDDATMPVSSPPVSETSATTPEG